MRYIIGIDPDTIKSGAATITQSGEVVSLLTLGFAELVDYVAKFQELHPDLSVVVEGGWLNHNNWHISRNSTPAQAAKIGNASGRNHQTGILIVEMLQHRGIKVDVIKPLRKCWHGVDRKITHEELADFTKMPQKRTNQEQRDALLLAWVYAKLPIQISAKLMLKYR